MNLGLPELIVVAAIAAIAAIFLVPLVVAIRARPLGEHPYRWATWIACQSAFGGLSILVSGIAMAAGGGFVEAAVSALAGAALLTGSIGLFLRKKYGAVLAIGGQSVLLAMGLLAARTNTTTVGPNQDALPAVATLGVLVLINGIYFKKRWAALSQQRRPEAEAGPIPT